MIQKIYQIDAFAEAVFLGNPAAVCLLKTWFSDDLMQKIAMENNLAETAFLVSTKNGFEIRWFTPICEVDLCGHATLASAFVLLEYEGFQGEKIDFYTKNSGKLTVVKDDKNLILNFPKDEIQKIEIDFKDCFAFYPKEIYKGKTDYLLIFENEEQILNLQPNFEKINQIETRGIIVSAKSEKYDFVSRFFAPQSGINEDPVTGSAHTTLVPYWSKVLNKTKLTAKQVSKRGGILNCELIGDSVMIGGKCFTYSIGNIFI